MKIDSKKIIWRNVLLFSVVYFAVFYVGIHIAFVRYFDVVNFLAKHPVVVPMRDPVWDSSELHTVSDVIDIPFNYGIIAFGFCFAVCLFRLRPIRHYWKEPLVALIFSLVLIFPSKWQFFIKPNVWTPGSLFEQRIYSYVANGTALLILAILSLVLVRKRKPQHLKFDFETNAPNNSFAKVGQT